MVRAKTFTLQGRVYPYFEHRYNAAGQNERTVEVPIALWYIRRFYRQPILEVGNVLGHYVERTWLCVDRYEVAAGVVNADVLAFTSSTGFDLIISISTLEHVRFDEAPRDPGAFVRVFGHLRGLLSDVGLLVVTVPLGYNPDVDGALFGGQLGDVDKCFMRRISAENEWQECSAVTAMGAQYNSPYPYANAIAVIYGVPEVVL